MLRPILSLALISQASGLALPTRSTPSSVQPSGAAPLGRRQAVVSAVSAVAAALCTDRVNAYDAIPLR